MTYRKIKLNINGISGIENNETKWNFRKNVHFTLPNKGGSLPLYKILGASC